jgi:hypothetical protein
VSGLAPPRAGDRLQRAFEPSHHLVRPLPAGGLVHEARKRAQLGLAAHRMMEAQIVGDLRHHGVEHGIAGEAEDVTPSRCLKALPGSAFAMRSAVLRSAIDALSPRLVPIRPRPRYAP